MGSAMMESIYCDFTKLPDDAGFQKWIGYADVKSAPVYFYVQRNSSFFTENTPIPFDLARVNEGNGMDLTSGIFTAPRPGIYFFSFAAVAHLEYSSGCWFTSTLILNGNLIGQSHVQSNSNVNQMSPLTLQSTLNLQKGDRVWVHMDYCGSSSYLYDVGAHLTHFTGFMLEEEIVAYL
ncbi:complement C1q tumor necrosis factor-related protein 2-like [Daphnia pulicaria]|uniref:complement C1q tumor necrosis factor-related protein 2-like n=1 Tax=Daphnia pulicaria TaxID=35523 RepID=UPI001EEC5C90|nr:complement C1q tumor necrosis factor-related protein 2-like [Daphnia pulicaria]